MIIIKKTMSRQQQQFKAYEEAHVHFVLSEFEKILHTNNLKFILDNISKESKNALLSQADQLMYCDG